MPLHFPLRPSVLPLLIIALLSGIHTTWVQGQDLGDLLGNGGDDEQAEQKTIPLASDSTSDAAIRSRLNEIFSNTQMLKQITVEVNSGVVTLRGEVLTHATADEAVSLARQVQGVAAVENALVRISNVGVRINYVLDNLRDRAYKFIAYSPLIVIAIIVFWGFWFLSGLVARWDYLFRKASNNTFVVDLLKQITRLVLMLIAAVIVLEILDATTLIGSLFGAVGLIGLAISFAIRDTVENYIASILLSIRRPFSPNDHIQLDSFEGKVIRLTSRATVLMTFDGNHVRIPNAIVYKGVITNFTRNPERRFQFEVGVDTDVDLTAARALAIKTLLETTGILETPPPSCQIETLGDSNVILSIMGWTDQNHFDFLKVRSAAIQAVKQAFDDADFEMPEPIYRLRVQGISDQALLTETRENRTLPNNQSAIEVEASHKNEALDVSKDTNLDRKIAAEAAVEDDLLNQAVSEE